MLEALVCIAVAVAPVKVAVTGFSHANISPDLTEAYAARFTSLLRENTELNVTSRQDIEQVLGLERQRALMGCESDNACLAEFSAALGVDALVSGNLARLDNGMLASLRAVRVRDGQSVFDVSGRVANETELIEWLEAQARPLASRLLESMGRGPPARGTSKWPRFLPGVAGLVLAGTGAALLGVSASDAATLRAGAANLTPDQIRATGQRGKTLQTVGPVLVGVGAAAVVATVVWIALGDPPVTASVGPVAGGGGAVLVGGRF